jgi:hypothetical protein
MRSPWIPCICLPLFVLVGILLLQWLFGSGIVEGALPPGTEIGLAGAAPASTASTPSSLVDTAVDVVTPDFVGKYLSRAVDTDSKILVEGFSNGWQGSALHEARIFCP